MALRDPVISSHHVSGFKYELSGLRTGSVRDQMLRAQLLVERLHKDQQIGHGRRLLVIGAGAAGVISAVTACALGVETTVIELQDRAFQTQLGVATRRLDPTEFDWPQPNWSHGRYVAAAFSLAAFDYSTDHASTLAFAWEIVYDRVRSGSIRLPGSLRHIKHDARSLSYLDLSHGVAVTPWPQAPHQPEIFGAAISCIGFQGERRKVPSVSSAGAVHNLVSSPFWGTDELAEPGFGVVPPRSVRVLISGGGDGAQQDFQRVLTGDFGKPLLARLGLQDVENDHSLHRVLTAEDFAKRAHAWMGTAQASEGILAAWHAPYVDLVDRIWSDWTRAGRLDLIAREVLRPEVSATWLVGSPSPSFCYGLNRLLTLLIARLHAHHSGREWALQNAQATASNRHVILYGHSLKDVAPVDAFSHSCGAACYGHPHEANAESKWGVSGIGEFDIVVIRHGVEQRPLFGLPVLSEQLVPYTHPG